MLQKSDENPSWDAKTAEEALNLAVRLQEGQRDNVTLDELTKTAGEAGIEKAHVISALNILSEQSKTGQSRTYSEGRLALMVMTGMFTFLAILLNTSPRSPSAPLLPLMMAILSVGLILSLILTRNK